MQGASRDALGAARDRLAALLREHPGAADRAALAEELFGVVALLDGQGALRRALSDPALPASHRAGLVDSLFGGQLTGAGLDVLRTVTRSAWSAPIDLVDALELLGVEALLSSAETADELDDIDDELFRFARILAAAPELRAALTDRGLPGERKVELLDALLGGRTRAQTRRLVSLAVLQPRGRTLEGALDAFARLAAARRERLVARVRTAIPLDPEMQRLLAAALQQVYGRALRPQYEVDPDIIGGVVVRVADEIFDGSVLHQLREARRTIAG